jgi:hypothetical protein
MILEKSSHIKITVHRDIRGNPTDYTFRWVGDSPITIIAHFDYHPNLPIDIDEKNGIITLGPYRLKIMEYLSWESAWKCHRMDVSFWRLRAFVHRLAHLWREARARAIITLAVWGLADYHPGRIPVFSDIKVVQFFKSLVKGKENAK